MNAGLSHLYKSWTPTAINHFFQNQKVKIDHDPSRQPYTTLCSMPPLYPLLPDKIDNLYSNEETAGFSDHHAALFCHSSEQLEDLTAKNDAAPACPLPELDDFDKRTGPEILIDKTGVADQNVSSP